MRNRIARARRSGPRLITDSEARDIERENGISGDIGCSVGFCHECESFVDEAAGKLHRPTCKAVEPSRRRAS